MADILLLDDHPVVMERAKGHPELPLVQTRQALVSGALRALIDVHPTKKLRHLHFDEEKVTQFGVSEETPVSLWEQQVPVTCLQREAGIRVMSAKPSATAVERLWHVFGDNLTAKRRSMKDSTLAELVYERMNCHLLDKDQAQGCGMPQQFESVLEWIDESVLDEVF